MTQNKQYKKPKTTTQQDPNDINIRHLEHLGQRAIIYFTLIYNISLNQDQVLHIWKLCKIIPIPNSNKNPQKGT